MILDMGKYKCGAHEPTYFIADISANHDGELDRALELIDLAAEAGAQAAKFQNFRASEIVSKEGFANLGVQLSHQAKWEKSVYEVYKDASIPWEWTEKLKNKCNTVGIDYFSTPYDFETVDMLEPFVNVYKVGSGDITWLEMLNKVSEKNKPVILATGASSLGDVQRAVHEILKQNKKLILMQCNTNYTGSIDNFKHIHLNVLKAYKTIFPEILLGLSDHTPGHSTVLGAVALGARVVEKHFTDDPSRNGPDHLFSMDPKTWKEMVLRTRELENALGSTDKKIEDNEKETAVVQRRCLYAANSMKAGNTIKRQDLVVLRPAYRDGIFPYEIDSLVGKELTVFVKKGECLKWNMFK